MPQATIKARLWRSLVSAGGGWPSRTQNALFENVLERCACPPGKSGLQPWAICGGVPGAMPQATIKARLWRSFDLVWCRAPRVEIIDLQVRGGQC